MKRHLEDDYPLDDPFRLGYRIQVLEPGGESEWIPLTADDLLDPQPNFEACQDGPHSSMLINLYDMLKRHFKSQDALVLPVMKLIWHIPGLPDPAPDIREPGGRHTHSPGREPWVRDEKYIVHVPSGTASTGVPEPLTGFLNDDVIAFPGLTPWAMSMPPSGLAVAFQSSPSYSRPSGPTAKPSNPSGSRAPEARRNVAPGASPGKGAI